MRTLIPSEIRRRWISLYDPPSILWVAVDANPYYEGVQGQGLPGVILDLTGSGRFFPPYQENAYLRPLPGGLAPPTQSGSSGLKGMLRRGDIAIILGDLRFTEWRGYLLDAVAGARARDAIVLVGLASNAQFPLEETTGALVEDINRQADLVLMDSTLNTSGSSCATVLQHLVNNHDGHRLLANLLAINNRGGFQLVSARPHRYGFVSLIEVSSGKEWLAQLTSAN